MRKILLLFTLVLVQLLSFGASAQTYSASGTMGIGFGPDRILIEGATVYADVQSGSNYVPVAGATCVTDAEGKWAISSLAPGTYQFRAEKPGYQMTPMSGVPLPFEGGNIDGFLNISAVIIETTLTGTVYDSWSASTTVRDIHVQVWNADQTTLLGEADCNTSQKFSIVLKGEVPSTVVLKISAPGYKTLVTTENINMGYTNTFSNLRIDEGSDEPVASSPYLVPKVTYTVSGVVKNEAGEALADVEIYADLNNTRVGETKTDAEGKWTLAGLEAGTYNFRALGPNWLSAGYNNNTEISANKSDINFTLTEKTSQIAITVWRADLTGKVDGAHVEIWTQDETPVLVGEGTSNSQGAVPQIPIKGKMGTYTLKATAEGFKPYSKDYTPKFYGQSNQTSIMMEVAPPVYTASGVVKDQEGNAVEGVGIYVSRKGEDGRFETLTGVNATTDAQGAWSIADLSAGTYQFRALKDGYKAAYNNDVELAADKADLDFTLEYVESTIGGKFLDKETLAPIAGGHIELWSTGENPELVYEATSNTEGKYPGFRVYGPFKTYTVKATAAGYEDYESEYTPSIYGQLNNCRVLMTASEWTFTAVVKGNQENGEVALLDKAVVTVTAEKQNESPKEVEVTNEGNGFYSFTVKGPETVDVTYVVKVTCEGYDGEGEYSFSFDGKDVEHEFVLNQTVGIARILQEMGEDTPIYTVNGLRVNSKEIKNLAPGIYIVGDRKVIVK